MATYSELFDLQAKGSLRNKVGVACVIAADAIRAEDVGTTNHVNRLLWAKAVMADPNREAERMMWGVLAANQAATSAAILAATDAAIQTAVNAAVNLFANGL
jgi:hypothetical protein